MNRDLRFEELEEYANEYDCSIAEAARDIVFDFFVAAGFWEDVLEKSDTEFIYYFASDGNYRTAEHEEYLEAWHDYWEWKEQTKKELGNLRYVCARIKLKYGGFPRKQGIIQANAIEMPQIRKLIALTNESFEKAYSE